MKYSCEIKISGIVASKELAFFVAPYLKASSLILLSGDLGAGKTTFVRNFLLSLGYNKSVTSPTFNIVKTYEVGHTFVNHIDAYRLEGRDEEIGLDELIESDDITFIEWPIYLNPRLLMKEHLDIEIKILNNDERLYVFNSNSKAYESLFINLKERYHA